LSAATAGIRSALPVGLCNVRVCDLPPSPGARTPGPIGWLRPPRAVLISRSGGREIEL
jgi:hypothetical protein